MNIKILCLYLRGVRYTFSLCVKVSYNYCRMSDLTLGNVFCPAPKHRIQLSVKYWQDSKISIWLSKKVCIWGSSDPSLGCNLLWSFSSLLQVHPYFSPYSFHNLCQSTYSHTLMLGETHSRMHGSTWLFILFRADHIHTAEIICLSLPAESPAPPQTPAKPWWLKLITNKTGQDDNL